MTKKHIWITIIAVVAAVALTLTAVVLSSDYLRNEILSELGIRTDKNPPAQSSTTNTAPSSSADAATITQEKAKEIALTHAEVLESEAVFERVYSYFDDGVLAYEVDFRVGNTEYDYEIDAKSGVVLEFDKDFERGNLPSENKVPSENKTSSDANSVYIGEERAKGIAIAHAKLSSDPQFVLVEFDNDRVPHYEIEFRFEGYDYEYEIDAKSGEVLNFDKDFDD